jgi:hypothetical protein
MTFDACSVITCALESARNLRPVPRMRVDPEPADRTVALHTDISVSMTGLTGGQIFAGLPGMGLRPLVMRQYTADMTALTLCWIKRSMYRTDR